MKLTAKITLTLALIGLSASAYADTMMGYVNIAITASTGEFQVVTSGNTNYFFQVFPTSPAYQATVATVLRNKSTNSQVNVQYTATKCVTVGTTYYCPIDAIQGY